MPSANRPGGNSPSASGEPKKTAPIARQSADTRRAESATRKPTEPRAPIGRESAVKPKVNQAPASSPSEKTAPKTQVPPVSHPPIQRAENRGDTDKNAATRPIKVPQSTVGQPSQRRVNPTGENRHPAQTTRETMQGMMKTRSADVYPVRDIKRLPNEKLPDRTLDRGNTIISVVKAIVYIIFVIVVSLFLSLFVIIVGNDVFAFVKSDEVVEVTIPEDADIEMIADVLYQNDIIKFPKIFTLYAKIQKDDGEFLAGTYTVNGMMNYDTLRSEFKEKFVMEVVEIKIPEGYTTDEIIDLFVSYGIGTREGFVDVIENYDFDYWFIDRLETSVLSADRIYRLDGYLFPDTYQFYTTSSEVTVINKLLKRFSQIFTKDYRDYCDQMGYTVDEIVTLASIIEKEAGSPAEFFNVSSVFHNRLNSPQNFPKLESDATIVYAIQHETGVRPTLTLDDLRYDTPYNSYLYDGLPPGAIANPSASALLSALQPASTNYYFFIANKGTTYFSQTRAEHEALRQKFRNEAEASNQPQLNVEP